MSVYVVFVGGGVVFGGGGGGGGGVGVAVADASAAVARPLKLLQAETEGTVDSLERPLGGGGGGGGGCLSSVSKVLRHGMSTRGSATPKKT